jgi:hypothetical protein
VSEEEFQQINKHLTANGDIDQQFSHAKNEPMNFFQLLMDNRLIIAASAKIDDEIRLHHLFYSNGATSLHTESNPRSITVLFCHCFRVIKKLVSLSLAKLCSSALQKPGS